MLQRLYIKNFVLIKEVELQFKPGLTVITGETGAGKSILLQAMGLILGDRADSFTVGNPEEKCAVEATFRLDESFTDFFKEEDLDFEEETLIRRELKANGKSRAFINDTPVTNKALRSLGQRLIDIHGQHDTQQLLDPIYQLQMLDVYGMHGELFQAYQQQYHQWRKAQQQLKNLRNQKQQDTRELEFKKFQWQELEAAKLESETELQELEDRLQFYERFEEINTLCTQVLSLSEEPISLHNVLGGIDKKAGSLAERMQSLQRISELSGELLNTLSDLEREAEKILADAEWDEEEQNKVSSRLDLLNSLLNKHLCKDLSELIGARNRLREELQGFDNLDEEIERLEAEESANRKDLENKAQALRQARKTAADNLCTEIASLLPLLNMASAEIKLNFTELPDFEEQGTDAVEFYGRMNKGGQFAPLARVASGGEISRIMLAIKTVLGEKMRLPTLIFDEIDTGLGGETASKMGSLLQKISGRSQVISITHLAQIAGKGTQHLKVIKREDDREANTLITELEADERLNEIARMISGEQISPEALANAKVLLN
ncbi:MAG: DNA repair protein RecN [Luteibaculum sp.]